MLPFLWSWLIFAYNVKALLEHSGRSSTGACPVVNVCVNTLSLCSRCANLAMAIATNQHESLYVGFFAESLSEPNPQNTYRGESWLIIQFIAHLHHLQLPKAWPLQRHNMFQQACCPLNIQGVAWALDSPKVPPDSRVQTDGKPPVYRSCPHTQKRTYRLRYIHSRVDIINVKLIHVQAYVCTMNRKDSYKLSYPMTWNYL